MSEIILTGPSVKRGKSKQDYRTPDVFRLPVINRFGYPIFDLAADASNAFAAPQQDPQFFTAEQDSLKQDWTKITGLRWLNPPFDQIAPWARKCHESTAGRYGPGILFLVPASVGSNWYRDFIHDRALVIFLNGRIPFDPENPKWGYPKDTMLVHFSSTQRGFEVWNWRT